MTLNAAATVGGVDLPAGARVEHVVRWEGGACRHVRLLSAVLGPVGAPHARRLAR